MGSGGTFLAEKAVKSVRKVEQEALNTDFADPNELAISALG
jgi:hypothetical protein